jgi:hypothetical protein
LRRSSLPILVALVAMVVGVESHRYTDPRTARAQDGTGLVAIYNGWNIGSVASGANVFATSKPPSQFASSLRVTVTLGSSVPLNVVWSDGTNTFTCPLNGGSALTAGDCYTFSVGSRNANAIGGSKGTTCASTVNFSVGGPTTVPVLWTDEVVGGVQ